MNLKEKANTLKTYIPALFIAMKRKDTPIVAKILACDCQYKSDPHDSVKLIHP